MVFRVEESRSSKFFERHSSSLLLLVIKWMRAPSDRTMILLVFRCFGEQRTDRSKPFRAIDAQKIVVIMIEMSFASIFNEVV